MVKFPQQIDESPTRSVTEGPGVYLDELLRSRLVGLQEFATVLAGDPELGARLVEDAILQSQDELRAVAEDVKAQYVIAREQTVRGFLSEDMRLGNPRAADVDTPRPVSREEIEDCDGVALRFAASSKLQRAVLLLRYSEGLSNEVIARSTGSTPARCGAYIAQMLTGLGGDAQTSPEAEEHAEADLRLLIDLLGEDAEPAVDELRERLLTRLPPEPEPIRQSDPVAEPTPEVKGGAPGGGVGRPRVVLAQLAPRHRVPKAAGTPQAVLTRPPAPVPQTSRPVPAPVREIEWRAYERHIATIMLVAIGFQYPFRFGATYGDVLAFLAAPLWLGAYRRYRGGVLFAIVGLVALLWGLLLQDTSSADHTIDAAGGRDTSVLFASMIVAVGVVLWARNLMSIGRIGALFGAGMLAYSVVTPGTWGTNPWKFAFAIPTAVAVLGLVAGARRTTLPVVTLVVLAAVSVQLDARAYSAALALCALVMLLGAARRRQSSARSRVVVATLIGAMAIAVYELATSLLVNGYLGRSAQQRSIAQIHESGSLILGGRPELAATIALMKHRIAGYGVGVIPTPNDVLTAKSGLASINYAPNNGYVEKYMFGGHFELHSVLGDVWVNWGLVGLALMAIVAVVVVHSIIDSASGGAGNALTVYLCVWTLWNLGFSPFLVSAPILVLAIGLNLRARA